MTVTAPAAFLGASMFRPALERDKAGNSYEAIGGGTHAERLEAEQFAESIAAKYGSAVAASTPVCVINERRPTSHVSVRYLTACGWLLANTKSINHSRTGLIKLMSSCEVVRHLLKDRAFLELNYESY
jgi:hypothetical protein